MNQTQDQDERAKGQGKRDADASSLLPAAIRLSPSESEDPRVARALEEYLAALEKGTAPVRDQFLAGHGEIAEVLAECLDGLEFIRGAAAQVRQPVATPPAVSALEVQPELPLGDYRIVREVGRGGMGVVYEAVQLSLGRRIALKVLPFAAALDAKQLQRFKNEAQAAAHLHHTNIVPVHAVGCERGVHYYAMQFIEGQTLAKVIVDLRLQSADLQTLLPSLARPAASWNLFPNPLPSRCSVSVPSVCSATLGGDESNQGKSADRPTKRPQRERVKAGIAQARPQ
jgi:hypothetical protein